MSVPLLQQELLVPEPRRKLIVRPGMTAHWGVDPGVQRISVASGPRVFTHALPQTDGLARLQVLHEGIQEFVGEVAMRLGAPGFILVEQPAGKTVDPILWYAVGTTIAALQVAVAEEYSMSVRVETMPPMSWKKIACGRGDIYKPKKGDEWEYGVLTWAKVNGYTGSSFDEADALGIAEAARRLVTLEAR